MAHGAALEMSCAQFGTNWMKKPPRIAPEIDASPPMTMPTRNVIERNTLNVSGATNAIESADSAPATPVYAALTPNVSDLYSGVLIPIACAAVGLSRMATMA